MARSATFRALMALLAAALVSPVGTATAAPKVSQSSLASELELAMRSAGSSSGAYVVNSSTGRRIFRKRSSTPRILASNTKLFTTSAALAQYGVEGRLNTSVRGRGALSAEGVFRGDLYLIGGGDPTFGSATFTRRAYGSGATVQTLASKLEDVGIRRVTGRVYGDESSFDSLRGGPDSGYRISPYVGPLSALAYNRGLTSENGSGYQSSPAGFAASALTGALRARDVRVTGAPRAKTTPSGTEELATAESPTMTRLTALTNKPSDNFFAEILLKDLALSTGRRGTTAAGASLATSFASRLGARPTRLADGSGLSRANRATPARVVALLRAMQRRDEFDEFFASLSIAGRDGTLGPRLRSGPARGNCRGKTGTLSNVSALSGYCRARSGDTYVFSILMNNVNPFGARQLQDRMAQAIAGVR
ncbi:MAG: D-alanyl-D-alanine carboxypeptidase/D-alanyl-D-alanine-endopeptidase [Thermoleophilaceae bacterium]|nr:D-alanyl-D-alanine carboxypeptidase/D-alanyl-D-alanine-endopeptidase [Thermoleophilaceae bacterium]